MMFTRVFLLAAAFAIFVGCVAEAQVVVIGGGRDSNCPIFTGGKCLSCPSGCQLSSDGMPGTEDFACICKCDEGSNKVCNIDDAPAPVAEKIQGNLEKGQEKFAEGQRKLEEGQKRLEEAEERMG